MKRFTGIAATVVALAFAGVAVDAHAQTRPAAKARPQLQAQAPAQSPNDWGPAARRRTLEFNTEGRWGLKLDYDENASRDDRFRDVEAGAYYRLSPSLRVGGSVGLSGDARRVRPLPEEEKPAPRVRLETIFRF